MTRRVGPPLAILGALMVVALILSLTGSPVRPAEAQTLRAPEALRAAETLRASRTRPHRATTATPTTIPVAASVPTTTIAPLANLPAPPSTLPLATKPQSAHVNPLLAELSGAGFAVVLGLMMLQWVLTRPRRRGRRTI